MLSPIDDTSCQSLVANLVTLPKTQSAASAASMGPERFLIESSAENLVEREFYLLTACFKIYIYIYVYIMNLFCLIWRYR